MNGLIAAWIDLRVMWLELRRAIAKAEIRAARRAGIEGTQSLQAFHQQCDEYEAQIDELNARQDALLGRHLL